MKYISKLFKKHEPVIYAWMYLGCIIIFAIVYFILPTGSFTVPKLDISNPITCLYFSTITITTVGYGDISPISIPAQIAVTLQPILGLFLVGFFLNALAQRQSQKISEDEKEKAALNEFNILKKRLLKVNEVLSLTISNYEQYVFALTTPIVRRVTEPVLVNQNFHFQDMSDLFAPTLFEAAPDESSVTLYFRRQKELTDEIKAFLLSTELTPWPDTEQACRNFLINCSRADISGTIAAHQKNDQEKQIIVKMINAYPSEPEYAEGSSLINPYVALYKLVKQNLALIEKYRTSITTATS
ncbi:potassium channel family protein [uncultured Mucilaginibacter sp.]|uniref:potassium channel family protein n=1 Tax=uncultured Mucilaginibacter sp. TaxID=797541 RepID=UPI0025F6DE4F|nr:potassium channel family protein [uncultured Mucilaginibacter sp.]